MDNIVTHHSKQTKSRRALLLLFGAMVLICAFVYMVKIGVVTKPVGQNSTYSPGKYAKSSPTGSDSSLGVPARSPANGTHLIKDLATAGHGQLVIVNGTQTDACVAIIDVSRNVQVRMIFVRANNSAELKQLSAGDYRVVFTTGIDWDASARRFARDAEYLNFGKTLTFEETRETGGIRFSKHTITLNETPEGNVHSEQIPESEFEALTKGEPTVP